MDQSLNLEKQRELQEHQQLPQEQYFESVEFFNMVDQDVESKQHAAKIAKINEKLKF